MHYVRIDTVYSLEIHLYRVSESIVHKTWNKEDKIEKT